MSRLRAPRRAAALLAFSSVIALMWLVVGCHGGHCEGGTCSCPVGGRCEFECEEPPCHVTCEGDNGECVGDCANGECTCGPGSSCEFGCASPPCHVACEGAECAGACANGDCNCEEGSSCSFTCDDGPCHVLCAGDNERCDGQCQNGSCSCGPDSTCTFECLDHNCSFDCAEGASCVVSCPSGSPGTQGCTFTECAAGEVLLCDDGKTMTCGAACPPPPEEDD